MSIVELTEQIREHAANGKPLRIVGGDSKSFYGHDLSELDSLSSAALDQIISYEPSELVLRVESGCSLATINRVLQEENQMLAFEPPDFGGSTIGGAIASGIAGSRRPFVGAGRDFLLGVGMIDGEGETFAFGGQVMKNVAGYDISRLMAGALGCLGFMTEVSLKVLPMPELEVSVSWPLTRDKFLDEAKQLGSEPEVTALAWWQNRLYVRYSGSEFTVQKKITKANGDPVAPTFWRELDTMALFSEAHTIRRVSCKPMDKSAASAAASLIDWGGAQRWVLDNTDFPPLQEAYTTVVKTSDTSLSRFAPLAPPIAALHQKLKASFDPKGIFNPGKMYKDL